MSATPETAPASAPTAAVPAGSQSTGRATGNTRWHGRVSPVVVTVLAAYLAFVGVRLTVFDGDVSGFVTAGDCITDAAAAPDGLYVSPDVDGYDGQAYYRLALSPLTNDLTDHGITFTRPAYWQTRIGYPLTSWVLSAGGQPPLVPIAMVLVNLLAIGAIVLLAARLARDLGRSPWWGALPALWGGYLVGLGQDLTEPLAGALLLAGLIALRRERWRAAALAFTAAALTRETTLLVPVVLIGLAMLDRTRRPTSPQRHDARHPRNSLRIPWWVGVVPLAVHLAWRTVVRLRWSDAPGVIDAPGDNILGVPFGALTGYLSRAWEVPGPAWPNLVLLTPTLVALTTVVLTLAIAARRGEGLRHEMIALAGYLVLMAMLPVWDRGQAYLRWGCEPVLLAWLIAIGHRSRPAAEPHPPGTSRLTALAATAALIWIITASQSLGYPRTDGPWSGLWTWS